jgi:hypothetical protein
VIGAPLPAVADGLPFTPDGACMQPSVPGVHGGLVFVDGFGSSLAQAEARPRAPTASSVHSRVEIIPTSDSSQTTRAHHSSIEMVCARAGCAEFLHSIKDKVSPRIPVAYDIAISAIPPSMDRFVS